MTSSRDDEYAFAGTDMTSFVRSWLAVLDGPNAVSAGLLEDALNDPVERDRCFYGAMFIAANSGPRAAETDASGDELRLFAVLAVFQQAGFPGTDATLWGGAAVHVRRAFDYASSLTPSVVARRLRQSVIDRAVAEDPPGYRAAINRSMKNDPARVAAHERRMASLLQREIRAANLIDPDGEADFDLQLLQGRPGT